MKRMAAFLLVLAMVLGISMQAQAALELRGEDSRGNRLIYDTDLNITWYDYTRIEYVLDSEYGYIPNAGYTFASQRYWADELSVTFGSNVYNDWRPPTTVDGPIVFGNDGSTTAGYNITSSELGHLFYTELGNKGYCDTSDNCPQAGWVVRGNTGIFQNLRSGTYWSGTESSAWQGYAWTFNTSLGNQVIDHKSYLHYAIAVRPGDVSVAVVPEPMSMVLFGVGGIVMAARRNLIRRRG